MTALVCVWTDTALSLYAQVCFCSAESAAVTSHSIFEWWIWRGRERETVGVEPQEER